MSRVDRVSNVLATDDTLINESSSSGYWSSEAKGTFQKGVSTDEIFALGRHAGLIPAAEHALLTDSPAASQALLVKPT